MILLKMAFKPLFGILNKFAQKAKIHIFCKFQGYSYKACVKFYLKYKKNIFY